MFVDAIELADMNGICECDDGKFVAVAAAAAATPFPPPPAPPPAANGAAVAATNGVGIWLMTCPVRLGGMVMEELPPLFIINCDAEDGGGFDK